VFTGREIGVYLLVGVAVSVRVLALALLILVQLTLPIFLALERPDSSAVPVSSHPFASPSFSAFFSSAPTASSPHVMFGC
jgi:hypothetical protein